MRIVNWFFHAFHVGLILFTAIGWMVAPLRTFHLAVCALTLFSWFGIGLLLGSPGFCAITEVHFWVRRRLGLQTLRESYMVYLARKLTGREPSAAVVEISTQAVFYGVMLLSIMLRRAG